VLAVDLTDRAAVAEAVSAAVARLGGLDVLVSNAVTGAFGHLLEVDADDFDRAVNITFGGAVNVIRAALPHLRDSRGTIIATVSLLCRVPMPSWSSYVAAKHALRGFLNSLRVEEREQRGGVRIAMVHAGIVDTPFWSYASSGTGRKPRVVPDAYSARVVARALVDCAARPRPEVVLGGGTLLLDRTYLVARGFAERVLAQVSDRGPAGDGSRSAPAGRSSRVALDAVSSPPVTAAPSPAAARRWARRAVSSARAPLIFDLAGGYRPPKMGLAHA
jgi:NAD(P)-dependent dehydrogenase (short-subunit alcohol dehydrogenase family)